MKEEYYAKDQNLYEDKKIEYKVKQFLSRCDRILEYSDIRGEYLSS